MPQGGTREQSRQADGSRLRSRHQERIDITARFTREWSERWSFVEVRDVKFAKIAFLAAGVWGIVLITPLYFLFNAIGRQHGSPITYPQFFYGFLSVTMAWQFAFLVIGSDPARFRLMMIPSMVEKLLYVVSMGVLYIEGRMPVMDAMIVAPDLVWGVLFMIAFAKTSVSAGVRLVDEC
jgi:hypothetical protein